MRAAALALASALVLAGCAGPAVLASPEEVRRSAYAHPGPASLTLYTVVNERTGRGAHTALMIAASERVLWDPAGSFRHPAVPERNDLLHGITPTIEIVYEDFHARDTHRIVEQTVAVPPAVAERALRLAAAQGPASRATCSLTTTRILQQLPGFEGVPVAWYPTRTMAAFGALPGVSTRTITGETADAAHNVVFRATRTAEAAGQLAPR